MGPSRQERLLALLIGDRGRDRSIAFREGPREFRAQLNEDTLWIAVKDNLILGEYERAGINLANLRGVVIDAGAHVGLFSLLASAHAKTVLALEAHPRNFSRLSGNIARNRSHNVVARQCALWSTEGQVTLVEGRHSAAGSIFEKHGSRFVVAAETLDSIVSTTGPVDLLKLDIEGAEFDVLDRASDETLRQIRAVVGEFHLEGRADRLAPTVERLRDVGFRVVVRRPPIAYWWETMRVLVRNRRRLRGEPRLRFSVAAVYSVVALARRLRERRSGPVVDELVFLYATRPTTKR